MFMTNPSDARAVAPSRKRKRLHSAWGTLTLCSRAVGLGTLLVVVMVGHAVAEPPEAAPPGAGDAQSGDAQPGDAQPGDAQPGAPVPPEKKSCHYDMSYKFPCCVPFPPPGPLPKYGGCLLQRRTITGDWWGARRDLACRGFTAELQVTTVSQYLASGGLGPLAPANDEFPTLGRGRLTLGLDTERAGLWRGGTVVGSIDYRTGKDVLGEAPSLGVSNSVSINPLAPNDEVALTELSLTQILSGNWAVQFGVINAVRVGDPNRFADGDGADQFLNWVFNMQAMYDFVFPTTTLGANVIWFPTGNPRDITGIVSVFNAYNGGSNPFEKLEGVIVQTGWIFGYKWGKMPGAHKFGATYAHNPTFKNLDRRLPNLPGGAIPVTKEDTWSVDYNWWQYFKTYDGAPGKGWGGFARLGASDGNPNPYHFSVSAGVGGDLPWRCHRDSFGVGVYYINTTDAPAVAGLLDDEVGLEAYYNFEVAPWFHVTLDAQVINSAIPETGTAVIFSLRTNWDF